GARPSFARGLSVTALIRFPGVTAVEAEPDIAARRGRAAKTDLVPGRRVRVINADCGPQHQARKKRLCRQTLPGVAADVIVLDRPQHRILLIGRQFAKAPAPPSAGFL